MPKREQGQEAVPHSAPWYKWLQVTQNLTSVLPRKKKKGVKGGAANRTMSNLPTYPTSHVLAYESLAVD